MSRTFKEAEQFAFDCWIEEKSPSGDVSDVHRKWKESKEYSDLLDEYRESFAPNGK